MQVEAFLEHNAARAPDKVALITGTRRWTYGEIESLSNNLAASLSLRGVRRWDRVVICMDNSAEMVVSIFATLKLGAVIVPVNPTTKVEKLAYILKDCGARCFISDYKTLASVRDIPLETALVPKSDVLSTPQSRVAPRKVGIDVDLAAVVYTSGSTGKPKGVMLSHGNVVSTAASISEYLENTADDVILCLLPLTFGYGLYQLLTAFRCGATLVLERSFAFPAATLDRVVQEKVTGFPLVPTIASILLQMQLDRWDLSGLRYITSAGAAMPLEHIAKIRRSLPYAKLYSMYGLTECQRASYLAPDQIDIRPGSVGRGMPNEDVYIVDEQGALVGPHVVGELVVRGSNVMQGYWGMPEATAQVLRPGRFPWERVLHSGDLFRADDEGYLYFVARKDEILKCRGQKVSPREIEDVLYRLSGVLEAAAIGIPDNVLGSAIHAVVVAEQGRTLTEKEVLHHCARHLEDFAVPVSVEFRSCLPRTNSGKIAKRELAHLEDIAA